MIQGSVFGLISLVILSSGLARAIDEPDGKSSRIYLPVIVLQGRNSQPEATVTPTLTPTPKPTATSRPTATTPAVTTTATPPGQSTKGIWISAEELSRLPTSGAAWEQLLNTADQPAGSPDLSNQDSDVNTRILAKALVYARIQQPRYREDVAKAIEAITYNNTENGGRTLALGRELAAYVISADLIDLAGYNPGLDFQFRQKLRQLLTKTLDGSTLQETHELRANNWGTHAGASRAAIAVYLGDQVELERVAQVFHGYLGNSSMYNGFEFGDDLSWQANPRTPLGVNPVGASKVGHSIDGALPEEMRRGGSFRWPPASTGYPWEGLQGAIVQAEILSRAGYPVWQWQDKAILRAVQFLYRIGWEPVNDDTWQIWLINHAYGSDFAADPVAQPGKNMGWTHWTHSR
jgi:hypothetical protein